MNPLGVWGDHPPKAQTSSKAIWGDGRWRIFDFKYNLIQQKYNFSLLIRYYETQFSWKQNNDYIQIEALIICFGKNKLRIFLLVIKEFKQEFWYVFDLQKWRYTAIGVQSWRTLKNIIFDTRTWNCFKVLRGGVHPKLLNFWALRLGP